MNATHLPPAMGNDRQGTHPDRMGPAADPITLPGPGLAHPGLPGPVPPGTAPAGGPAGHPEPPAPRRVWLWVTLGLVAALGGGGYYLYGQHRQAALAIPTSPAASQPEPLSQGEFRLSDTEMRALRIEEMQSRGFRAERVAEGRIAYNEDRSTPVFTPYNGRVVKVNARLGDTLAPGGTLFEVETTDLAGAANDLLSAADAANKARGALDQARREEARQNSLFSARATSQREVEQARVATAAAVADQRSAEATLAAARDKLRVLGRSAEQIARIEQSRMVDAVVPVTAPMGGTVVQRRVGPGQWLSTGATDPVFTIADLSTVWLVAAVREMDAPMIKLGQPVEVSVGALPGRTFDARIATIGAGLDAATRRLTVRAEVQDPEHLLKPEMFATFRIAVGDGQENVGVPVNAIIYRGAEASVWVALDGNRFILRRITPGIRAGDMVEVTEGLKPGDRVVTGGALFIDRAARID